MDLGVKYSSEVWILLESCIKHTLQRGPSICGMLWWAEGGEEGRRMLWRRLQSHKPAALLVINEDLQTSGTQPLGINRRNN